MGDVKLVIVDKNKTLYTTGEGEVSVIHDDKCSPKEILKSAQTYTDKISNGSLSNPNVRLTPSSIKTKNIRTASEEELKRTDIECELYTKNIKQSES